jgi:tetratricopeptide (TPR) repeat protein
MRQMKNFASLLLCVLLAACASEPVAPPENQQSLFNDTLFAAPSERIDVNDIFALDANMQSFLEHEVAGREMMDGKVMALTNSLYSTYHKKFAYDAVQTRAAADVFRLRSGNCLSYTIMTAAFAKQMRIPVQFHAVSYGEVWDRNENIEFKIGHVNLTLGHIVPAADHEPAKLIDFTSAEDARGEILDDIGEDVIIAMYLNNRAAEALAKDNLDDAYWWARAAMVHTPSFLSAYNTMGVIYSRHHNLAQSEQVFQRVLQREPDNVLAMSNQIQVLDKLGRAEESSKLASRLAEIQPNPPYYFFNLGLAAMREHDYVEARLEFKKEVNRASYNHQFHFWLGLANYYLGNFDETRRQLQVAMENSPNDKQHNLYAAKLEMMKSR